MNLPGIEFGPRTSLTSLWLGQILTEHLPAPCQGQRWGRNKGSLSSLQSLASRSWCPAFCWRVQSLLSTLCIPGAVQGAGMHWQRRQCPCPKAIPSLEQKRPDRSMPRQRFLKSPGIEEGPPTTAPLGPLFIFLTHQAQIFKQLCFVHRIKCKNPVSTEKALVIWP